MNRQTPNKMYALGRLPIGSMNKTETLYAERLNAMRHHGEIVWQKFEAVKLRLADNTFYSPDFAVMAADGVMEMHEVKGFWQDDAKVKIKVAAAQYPFRFFAVYAPKRKGDDWRVEAVG